MDRSAQTPVTHLLADFILGTRWDNLPQAVRREAVRAFVNWLGCTLGGANTETIEAAVRGTKMAPRSKHFNQAEMTRCAA